MSRVVRYMPPVENMSGKLDSKDTRQGVGGKKVYVGVNYLKRHGGNNHQGFSLLDKKFAYKTADTEASGQAIQDKFRRVAAATKIRKMDPEMQAQDQLAYRNQKKYGTYWGFLFATVWATIDD